MRILQILLGSCLLFFPFIAAKAQTNPLSSEGKYRAGWRSVTVARANSTTFTARLFYPALANGQNAAYDNRGAPYPAITFGHGFVQAVSTYQSTLEHLATHGYFVIASDSEGGLFPSHQNFAGDLRQSLTYLEQENANAASFLFNQVATAGFGASGHSMGGGASILAASQDARIRALANLAAAETNPSAIGAMPNVSAPAMLIAGSADTIVPLAQHGQLMYGSGNAPKILPVIQGGWHCGFQDAQGFGCDSSPQITRAQQLAETRRLLTAFFNLYLKRDETVWKQIWGAQLNNAFVQSQRDSGIEIAPSVQSVIAPVGENIDFAVTVTNRTKAPASFTVAVESRRWSLRVDPQTTRVLAPGESQAIVFSVRRLWKNSRSLNEIFVSVRRQADNLTRNFATINLQ